MQLRVHAVNNKYLFIILLFWGILAGNIMDTDAGFAYADPDPCTGSTIFRIGCGIYDITGPAAELGMMGYAMLYQRTAGIHTRLWSRAFVIISPCSGKRVVIVSTDVDLICQSVRQKVLEKLKATYGSLYSEQNVLMSAIHNHSGPGGYSHYTLYNLTTLGFDRQNFETITEGIYQSIVRAHNHTADGRIKILRGELLDTSINRSQGAYSKNPASERASYATDTDKRMTLLRFEGLDGRETGTINWFGVHCTSMGHDNLLISSDNKGYAEYLFERLKGTDYTAEETFVAAFAQASEGDSSPNIYGGENGGGADDFESTEISGRKQFNKALELYNSASQFLTGGVDYRHTYVKMDEVNIDPQFTGNGAQRTCPGAIGLSMLAGAEDGPGFGSEGLTCADLQKIWPMLICTPVTTTPCQGEKPIVLKTGEMRPYPWSPEVLPLQVIRIGNLVLAALPFEITTMAGRRLEKTVYEHLAPAGVDTVVVAPVANSYAGYITTREEYTTQNYEGAFNQFGPWTLAALQQEYYKLADALKLGTPVNPGPTPRDLSLSQAMLLPGVLFDDVPLFNHFGSVYKDADASYNRGQTVTVVFWSGHPKNSLNIQGTFLKVQKLVGTSWVTVAQDYDWETKFKWERNYWLPTFACSQVTIEWKIPMDAALGTYRLQHDGHWKSAWNGSIRPYTGTSRQFAVN